MRVLHRVNRIVLLFPALSVLAGCGGNPAMTCAITYQVQVSPASATVNHAAKPPANQTHFVSIASPTAPAGCAIPAIEALEFPTWSNPDPADIEISSASNNTNGTAVCKSATSGPVTLTGTYTQIVSSPVTKTVQLSCN